MASTQHFPCQWGGFLDLPWYTAGYQVHVFLDLIQADALVSNYLGQLQFEGVLKVPSGLSGFFYVAMM